MRQSRYVLMVIALAALILLPATAAMSQTPEVPITYPGDTDETISRRAKWIEGAKMEGELVWWGILRPPEANRVIPEFNKVYPFIKVNYWRGRGEEVAAKVEAEYAGRRYTVDVMLGGEPYNYPRWSKNGIIAEYVSSVPGIHQVDKRMYSKRGDWMIPAFAPKIPQYNTNLVSKEELPKTWEDLLDPKWKGHLGAEVEADNWATMALAEGGWGIKRTEDFLKRLREQQPKNIRGGSAAHTLLIAGEFSIMAMGNLRHVMISRKKGAPVDWIRVDPVLCTGPSLILAKQAPHPNAARLFLEWQLSPKGRLVYANVSQNYAPGINTPIAQQLEGRTLVVRTEEAEIEALDLDLINRLNNLYLGIQE